MFICYIDWCLYAEIWPPTQRAGAWGLELANENEEHKLHWCFCVYSGGHALKGQQDWRSSLISSASVLFTWFAALSLFYPCMLILVFSHAFLFICNLLLISLYTTGFSVPFRVLRPLLCVTKYFYLNGVCCSCEFGSAVQVLVQVRCWGWDNDIFFLTQFGTYFSRWHFQSSTLSVSAWFLWDRAGPGPGWHVHRRPSETWRISVTAIVQWAVLPSAEMPPHSWAHLPMQQFSWQLNLVLLNHSKQCF